MSFQRTNSPFTGAFFLSPTSPLAAGNGSLQLANGQIGLFRVADRTTNGMRAYSSLAGASAKEEFKIAVGTGRRSDAGNITNRNMETIPFTKDEILDVTYSAAQAPVLASVTLGYNGVAGTGISLQEKQASQISLTLKGDALSYMGFRDGEATMQFTIFAGNPEDCDNCATPCSTVSCKDITTDLVERIREHELRAGSDAGTGASIKVGDLVEVIGNYSCVIFPTPSSTATYYTLTLNDTGTQEALGVVQAQYPDLDVVRIEREGITSVYQIIDTVGTVPADFDPVTPNELLFDCDCPTGYTASVIGGYVYEITSDDGGTDNSSTLLDAAIGVSDQTGAVFTFENLGAADASRSVGTYTGVASTASGAGTGATFTVVVGAGGAVTSLTVVAEGSGYVVGETITIVDALLGGGGAVDFTFDVASLATQATSVTRFSGNGSIGRYVVVFPTQLSQTQIDNFVASDGSATIDFLRVADEICIPDSQPADVAWVSGDTCNLYTKDYYIDLKDTVCGDSRLTELQEAFPDLTITEDTSVEHENCRRRFTTTVTSNVVCEDCETPEPIFEAPEDFSGERWYEVPAADGALTSFTVAEASGFGVSASVTNNITTGITTSGSGSGATFQVIINAAGDGIETITYTSAGSGYAVGDTITIAGDQFSGGATPADDVTLTVTGISGVFPDDCECGITFKAKEGYLCPPDMLEDLGTFTPKGLRIQVSGGEAPHYLLEGYKFVTTPFHVSYDERPFDGTGWGSMLKRVEKASHEYFLGASPIRNYSEGYMMGFETKLENCSQYDAITVKIKRKNYAGRPSNIYNEEIRYTFYFDAGDKCTYADFFNTLGGEIVCP